MIEDVIIITALGIIPIILWSYPKTRMTTNNWITALKSVPLGCLTFIIIAMFIPTKSINLWYLALLIGSFLSVIHISNSLINKLYHADKDIESLLIPFISVTLFFILTFAIINFIIYMN